MAPSPMVHFPQAARPRFFDDVHHLWQCWHPSSIIVKSVVESKVWMIGTTAVGRRSFEVPRISQEQKQRNRERIVAAAGRGFRARGIDGVGIDEVMKTAGMTHGGFYNHFSSKDDLALEVL